MSLSPALLVGAGLFFAGVLLALVVVFASGGARKSRQLGVLAALLRGERGGARRGLLVLGVLLSVAGGVTSCGAVAAHDRARARRCQAFCLGRGYAAGKIGPADGAERFVACTCSAPDGRREQVPADAVP